MSILHPTGFGACGGHGMPMQSPSMVTVIVNEQPSSMRPSQLSSLPLLQTSGGITTPHPEFSHGPHARNSEVPPHVCVPLLQLGCIACHAEPMKHGWVAPMLQEQFSSTKPFRSSSRPLSQTSVACLSGGVTGCPVQAPPP